MPAAAAVPTTTPAAIGTHAGALPTTATVAAVARAAAPTPTPVSMATWLGDFPS